MSFLPTSDNFFLNFYSELAKLFNQPLNNKICKGLLTLLQVICSVLQIINQIIKDSTDFQENACLIGLVGTTSVPVFIYSLRIIALLSGHFTLGLNFLNYTIMLLFIVIFIFLHLLSFLG